MDPLIAEAFSRNKLHEVQHFYCGASEWDLQIQKWIRGDGGEPKAITLLAQGGTEVFLYKRANGDLVGFGALTKHRWKIDGQWHNITLLHTLGIQQQFQGLPEGPIEERYSTQMISDLGARAVSYGRPIWGLLVHKQNLRARRFYERIGFSLIEEVRDKYVRMFMNICPEPPQ